MCPRRLLAALLVSAVFVTPHHRAAAQSNILDRARKLAQDAANAGKKAVTGEVNRQVNSAVANAAEQDVADGSFTAVFSPWAGSDGKRVELARYSGSAFVANTPTGRQIILCDTRSTLPWQATFTILNGPPNGGGRGGAGASGGGGAGRSGSGGTAGGNGASTGGRAGTNAATPGTGAPASSGRGGGAAGGPTTSTGRGTPARGGGTPPVGGAGNTPATSGNGGGTGRGAGGSGGRGGASGAAGAGGGGGGGRGGDSAGASGSGPSAKADAAPSAGERDYKFPTTLITVTLPVTGVKAGTPGQGSFRVADVSETAVAGGATIRFAQATIPGEKAPEVVDLGVAFKARAFPNGQATAGCLAPMSGGRGSVAAGGPGARGSGAPAAGDRGSVAAPVERGVNPAPPVNQPAAGPAPAGPVFAAGDILTPKIDNVKLLQEAKDSAVVASTLKKGDELVYLGDDQNGFAHVQSSAAEGWVKKVLLTKH